MTLGPVMIDVEGTTLSATDRTLIAHPQTGGVILFSRNFVDLPQLCKLVDDIHAVKKPAVLVAVDQEGGRVQRFKDPFVTLPPLRVFGRAYDSDPAAAIASARECAWLMASELRCAGVDMSFAPVLDLDHGLSDIIGNRSFHRKAEAVVQLAKAYVRGMEEAGMAATGKHFPGHGAVVADSHVALPIDRRSSEQLKDDLLPFRRLISAGLPAIMTAHVVYPSVADAPATFSPRWIERILRGRFGFAGAVFSDDLSMAGAAVIGDVTARADAALAAGCDMLPVCNDRNAAERVLDHLSGHSNPLSQLRLLRLHGRGRGDLGRLQRSARHQTICKAMARLTDNGPFELRADDTGQ